MVKVVLWAALMSFVSFLVGAMAYCVLLNAYSLIAPVFGWPKPYLLALTPVEATFIIFITGLLTWAFFRLWLRLFWRTHTSLVTAGYRNERV